MDNEKIAVHVPHPLLWDAVVAHAKAQGQRWHGLAATWESGGRKEHTAIRTNGPDGMTYSTDDWYRNDGYTIITVDEYFKRTTLPTLRVGDYDVTDINDKGFSVGCTHVTWTLAEQIMARRPSASK